MSELFDQDFHVIFGCFIADMEIFHYCLSKETMDVNNSGQVHNVTVPRRKDDQMIMIHPLHVRSRMMYNMYLPESSC